MTRASRIEEAARALVRSWESDPDGSGLLHRMPALRAALSTQEEPMRALTETHAAAWCEGYAVGVEAAAKRVERARVVCNGPLPESTEVLVGGIQACLASIAREIRILAPQEPPAADQKETT